MTNKLLNKLSLTVVIVAMNVSLVFCQVGIVDVAMRQAPDEEKSINISPMIDGETEITIVQNGQVVLETVATQFATIPLPLASGVYRVIATHHPTERREIHLLQLED